MTDRAVVVGTNYQGTDYELSGCLNDALDWGALLGGKGYLVTPLLGSAAIRDVIEETLLREVAALGWGDRLVVTYSGHGTYVPDRNGDEVDGYDEAWCPDDMQTAGLITDDTLGSIFDTARTGVGILVLSDSCYSGTMTRFAPDARPGDVRFLHPARIASVPQVSSGNEERSEPLRRDYNSRASLVSGSSEWDVSYDAWFGSRANGAFTRAAIDAYQSGMSLSAWHKATVALLASWKQFPQVPQLLAASAYRKYLRAL